DVGNPYLLAYLMPPGAEEFENFVSYWLNLKRTNGFEARQRAFWVERIPRADPTRPPARTVFGPMTREKSRSSPWLCKNA
ncbi:MAG: hypothetical protein ABW214_05835, partial [Terrimicrobiaceae bacterium]